MTKSINSKSVFMALVAMLIFGVVTAMPASASANWSYGSPYGSYIGNQYSYNHSYSTPIVVQQPVYVQQPVIVQQPIYVTQPVVVQQPVYVQPVYNQLTVSCSASATYNTNNALASVTWTANVSGGNGYYSYSWSGTDGLSGSYKSVYYNYTNPGQKYATVTVYSDGQSVNRSCSSINVNPVYYQTVYQPTYQVVQPISVAYANQAPRNLDIGCFVDPTNAKINQPVNWTAEVTGGVAPYTYSWTGSDNLSGSQSSIIKYYSTVGSKSAIVTVTSADGRTGVKACSNAITIASAYKAPIKTTVKAAVPTSNPTATAISTSNVTPAPTVVLAPTSVSAASMFSMQNVPWGWVAVIIILILFFTVMYLLFNKTKI